mgnify:FL=1|tara:strand:+ start:1872 stop:2105 length:234 start_codon:yes stop_codon:yes gene_type:complete
MFENFIPALIQLLGFLGVFGFFVYQLLSDKKNTQPKISNSKSKDNNLKKEVKRGLFGKKQKETVLEEPLKNKKKRWF